MDSQGSQAAKKILVIDDEPGVVELLEETLKSAGYQVESAYNGVKGLEKVKKMVPDLILLDVIMEGMDGFEVLERLKKDKKFMNIPVIMLTGRTEPECVEKAIQCYADKYITKPVDLNVLLEEIRKSVSIVRGS